MNAELENGRQTIVRSSVAAAVICSHVPAEDSRIFLKRSTNSVYSCLKMDVGVYVTYAQCATNYEKGEKRMCYQRGIYHPLV